MKPAMQDRLLRFTVIASAQFVIVTILAMLFYSGGHAGDDTVQGYTFFRNFFSDLGLTVAHSGDPNTISAILFFFALNVAGLGLLAYFITIPNFFFGSLVGKVLSVLGSLAGIISGVSYMGVAFTPADIYLDPHIIFVQWAFTAFFVSALIYTIAIFITRKLPYWMGFVYIGFTVCLAAYLWLIFVGPEGITGEQNLIIQVTGQKLIAYAGIISTLILAVGQRKLIAEHTA